MDYDLIGVVVGALSGIIATWVKMTNEVTKIKSRLYSLEKQETKVQETLEVLVSGINEIKILLAKKGIEWGKLTKSYCIVQTLSKAHTLT